MDEIIREYYSRFKEIEPILEDKLKKLDRNKDVKSEFAYWIEHQKYVDDGVKINGYTAKSIAEKSRYLYGEGAFMTIIELRDHPDKVIRMLNEKLRMK